MFLQHLTHRNHPWRHFRVRILGPTKITRVLRIWVPSGRDPTENSLGRGKGSHVTHRLEKFRSYYDFSVLFFELRWHLAILRLCPGTWHPFPDRLAKASFFSPFWLDRQEWWALPPDQSLTEGGGLEWLRPAAHSYTSSYGPRVVHLRAFSCDCFTSSLLKVPKSSR